MSGRTFVVRKCLGLKNREVILTLGGSHSVFVPGRQKHRLLKLELPGCLTFPKLREPRLGGL